MPRYRLVDVQSKRVVYIPADTVTLFASLVGVLNEPKPLQLDPHLFEEFAALYGVRAERVPFGSEVYAANEGDYHRAILLPPKE